MSVLQKYKDLIAMAKDKITETMAPLRATEMKAKAELEIAKIESSIAEKEQKINELSAQYPINFDAMIDAIDDLDLVKRRKTQFQKIIDEMFS